MKDTVYERYQRAKYRSRDSGTGISLLPILFACEITLNLIQRSSSLTKTYKLFV